MNLERRHLPQKTTPHAIGHRDARNGSDAPPIPTETIYKLGIRVPGKPPQINGDVEIDTFHTNGGHKERITVSAIFPVVEKPLTFAIKTKRGVVGGGRSKKSSIEARRKLKKAKKSSRK